MLLPDNIAPEDCIYYNGAVVMDIMLKEKHMMLTDLFFEVKKKKNLSFGMLLLCLDWLYLINCVIVKKEEVTLCL